MIIISQDKKTIINFKGITRVSIVPPVEKGYKYSIAINGCLDLGYYETEERAKEVLIAIMASYQANKILECTHGSIEQNQMVETFLESGALPFKYEMPEE